MKISTIVKVLAAMSLVAAINAGQSMESNQEITLYLGNGHLISDTLLAPARQTATRIFAGVGLQLQWRLAPAKRMPAAAWTNCTKRAVEIRVDFIQGIPEDVTDWALARSFPYETKELRIDVLVDRFRRELRSRPLLAPRLLGHALAHEIAHLLQGVNRHSESGILRARWSESDYEQMQSRLLEFDLADVKLIHLGTESRLRRQCH